jgi:hypothetical protein
MDRLDLAVEMRTSIDGFHHLIKISGASGDGDGDAASAAAFPTVGEELCESMFWLQARSSPARG